MSSAESEAGPSVTESASKMEADTAGAGAGGASSADGAGSHTLEGGEDVHANQTGLGEADATAVGPGRRLFSPWEVVFCVRLDGIDGKDCKFSISPPSTLQSTLERASGSEGGLGVSLEALYWVERPARGGIHRVPDEEIWTLMMTQFLTDLPRSRTSLKYITESSGQIVTNPDDIPESKRWEAKPYGMTAQALKTLWAISCDHRTHAAVMRSSLQNVVKTIRASWAEGNVVATLGCKLLARLAIRPENLGILARIGLAGVLLETRKAQQLEANGPCSVDSDVLNVLAALSAHSKGKLLTATTAGPALLTLALANTETEVGPSALRLLASCAPLRPELATPAVASSLDQLMAMAQSPTSHEDVKVAFAGLLAATMSQGLRPTPQALHELLRIALWSVGKDEVACLVEGEEQEAKLRNLEDGILSVHTDEAGEGSTDPSDAWKANHPALYLSSQQQAKDDTPVHPPPLRRSRAMRAAAPLAAHALWVFMHSVSSTIGQGKPLADCFGSLQQKKTRGFQAEPEPSVDDESSISVLTLAKDPAQHLGRVFLVLDALLPQPDGHVSSAVFASFAHMCDIANVPALEPLRLYRRLLSSSPRLLKKSLLASPGSRAHLCAMNWLIRMVSSAHSDADRMTLWRSGASELICQSIDPLVQRHRKLTKIPGSRSTQSPPSRERRGRRRRRSSVDRLSSAMKSEASASQQTEQALSRVSGFVAGPLKGTSDPVGLGGKVAASGSSKDDVVSALRSTAAALMLLRPSKDKVTDEVMKTCVSMLRIGDPAVLGYTALGLWGLCLHPENRKLAIKHGALELLCGWNSVLLLARACHGGDLSLDELPTVARDMGTLQEVVALNEKLLCAVWLMLTTQEGVTAALADDLLPGIMDVARKPQSVIADLQYLAISAVWSAVLVSPDACMHSILTHKFAECLFVTVGRMEDPLPMAYRLYALRCLTSLQVLNKAAVMKALVAEHGKHPMERLVACLLMSADDGEAVVEITALMSCFTSKASKTEFGKLGVQPHLLNLLRASGDEQVMLSTAYCLLSLSTVPANQLELGNLGLAILFELSRTSYSPHLSAVAAKIITNISRHTKNRTLIYKGELFYRSLDSHMKDGGLTKAERLFLELKVQAAQDSLAAPSGTHRRSVLSALSQPGTDESRRGSQPSLNVVTGLDPSRGGGPGPGSGTPSTNGRAHLPPVDTTLAALRAGSPHGSRASTPKQAGTPTNASASGRPRAGTARSGTSAAEGKSDSMAEGKTGADASEAEAGATDGPASGSAGLGAAAPVPVPVGVDDDESSEKHKRPDYASMPGGLRGQALEWLDSLQRDSAKGDGSDHDSAFGGGVLNSGLVLSLLQPLSPDDPTRPFLPAIVRFPASESLAADVGLFAGITSNIEQPGVTSDETGPDSSFTRAPPLRSKPIRSTLCSKLVTLRGVANTLSTAGPPGLEKAGPEFFSAEPVMVPAGAGMGYDPGSTGPLRATGLFNPSDDGPGFDDEGKGDDGEGPEDDFSARQGAPGPTSSPGFPGRAPRLATRLPGRGFASGSVIPPVIAADEHSAIQLGGYRSRLPNRTPLTLEPVVKQRSATVKTVIPGRQRLEPLGRTASSDELHVEGGKEEYLEEEGELTRHTDSSPAPGETKSSKGASSRKPPGGRRRKKSTLVTTATHFDIDPRLSSLPAKKMPGIFQEGVDGDLARLSRLREHNPNSPASTAKKKKNTKYDYQVDEDDDDGEEVNLFVRVQEQRVIPSGRPASQQGSLSATGKSLPGLATTWPSSSGPLPPVSPLTDGKDLGTTGFGATAGGVTSSPGLPHKKLAKPWWTEPGTPWDVNVGGYLLTSVKHVKEKLLAAGNTTVAESSEAGVSMSGTLRPSTPEGPLPEVKAGPRFPGTLVGQLGAGNSEGLTLSMFESPRPAPSNDPMKVSVGAGTSRHNIRFHWQRDTSAGVNPDGPSVSMFKFEHVDGCEVCNELYPHYTLPDGRIVHFYYQDHLQEMVFEYVNTGPTAPVTLDAIRQGTYPTVPDAMEPVRSDMPPAPTPPRADMEPPTDAEGLVHTVNFIAMPKSSPAVPPEYSVNATVWELRKTESESEDYTNAQKVVWQAFDQVWAKVGLQDYISGIVDKSSARPEIASASTILDEVKEAIKSRFLLLRQVFDFYATRSPEEQPPFFLNVQDLLEFADLTRFAGRCGHPTPFRSADAVLRAMLPGANEKTNIDISAFFEALVRLAGACRSVDHPIEPLGMKLNWLLDKFVCSHQNPGTNMQDPDHFRRDRLYNQEVAVVLHRHRKVLRPLFAKYSTKRSKSDCRLLTLRKWVEMLSDAELLDDQFSLREAQVVFSWSRMMATNESLAEGHCLYYTDFMEALCRVADLVVVPLPEDLSNTPSASALHWHVATAAPNPVRARRLSTEWSCGSKRPLAEKLPTFLERFTLALAYTMTEGDGAGPLSRKMFRNWGIKLRALPASSDAIPAPVAPQRTVVEGGSGDAASGEGAGAAASSGDGAEGEPTAGGGGSDGGADDDDGASGFSTDPSSDEEEGESEFSEGEESEPEGED